MKIRSIVAAVATLFVVQGYATEISTAEEFVSLITADPAGSYTLTQDIDLTNSGYETIAEFRGSLDGAGHSIRGLGARPLFTTICGTVADLTVDGEVDGKVTAYSFAGDAIAGVFCATNDSGSILRSTVKNYKLAGSGSGCKIGLFAAVASNEATFEGCVTDESCTCNANNSANNHYSYGGCFVGVVRTSGTPVRAANFISCTNNAAGGFNMECYSGGSFGGIVGNFSSLEYPCVIRDCVNNGTISSNKKGSVMGGIFGGGGAAPGNDGKLLVVGCVNNGSVVASATSGGFWLGGLGGTCGSCIVLSNCVNRANISCASGSSNCAGLFNDGTGEIMKNTIQRCYDCANYGDISAMSQAGGFNASSKSNADYGGTGIYYSNCANYGTISSPIADEFVPAGLESKNRSFTARSNRTVGNSFAMTRNIEFYNDEHPEARWWFTVSDCITAEDGGYEAQSAAKALTKGAKALGLGEWCCGRVNGNIVPELVAFCQDPVRKGLLLIIR